MPALPDANEPTMGTSVGARSRNKRPTATSWATGYLAGSKTAVKNTKPRAVNEIVPISPIVDVSHIQ